MYCAHGFHPDLPSYCVAQHTLFLPSPPKTEAPEAKPPAPLSCSATFAPSPQPADHPSKQRCRKQSPRHPYLTQQLSPQPNWLLGTHFTILTLPSTCPPIRILPTYKPLGKFKSNVNCPAACVKPCTCTRRPVMSCTSKVTPSSLRGLPRS